MPDTALPPLDKVDPVKAWQPWEPTPADPFDLKWAGHLYRRAAFGGTLPELRQAVAGGLPATLDKLFHPSPADESKRKSLEQLSPGLVEDGLRLRGWWVYMVLNSPEPLREKMTLFWHNHFATSLAKVQRPVMMYHQNLTLRKNAMGKLPVLVHEISKDPAMLVWLDSNSNIKGKANENFARELMELFTLGVGNYAEADIREAARAFTGWQTEDNKFEFDETLHDGGVKTVLGQTGNFNGEKIVDIVLSQPAAARFLVRKLYSYFISEYAAPPDALLEPLAGSFRSSGYDIGALVKTILSSRHFFSGYAYRQRIKNPVEFVAGTLRVSWRRSPSPEERGFVDMPTLAAEISTMGQELFAPPNVKGWPGGRSWLNTATVLARHNFAHKIATGHLANTRPVDAEAPVALTPDGEPATTKKEAELPEPEKHRDIAALVQEAKVSEPARVVDFLVDLLLQGPISKTAHGKLTSYLADGKPTGPALNRRIRETAHAIMTMPEYQLA
jgi:uncharacterized protein (DUF1800 family)